MPGREGHFLAINCSWFSRLAIFSKLVAGVIQAFWAIVRWRRRGRIQELDAFISFALETLPPRGPIGAGVSGFILRQVSMHLARPYIRDLLSAERA
jgi:hypothetical protein